MIAGKCAVPCLRLYRALGRELLFSQTHARAAATNLLRPLGDSLVEQKYLQELLVESSTPKAKRFPQRNFDYL